MLTHLSIEIWFFDTQNTFYLIVRGLKNAYFMSITPLLYRFLTILWQSSNIREKLGILLFWWKLLFSCVKSVSKYIQGVFFYWSAQFSVPKWKTMGSQSEILFHEILDVQKILIGWTTFFFLALKFGRTSQKNHPVWPNQVTLVSWTQP